MPRKNEDETEGAPCGGATGKKPNRRLNKRIGTGQIGRKKERERTKMGEGQVAGEKGAEDEENGSQYPLEHIDRSYSYYLH